MMILAIALSTAAAGPPVGLSPSGGEPVYCGHDGATPHFTFSRGTPVPKATDGLPDTLIQISTSSAFLAGEAAVYGDQVPAILERYVRAEPLPVAVGDAAEGTVYWWRVGRRHNGTGTPMMTRQQPTTVVWSEPISFRATVPAARATVPARELSWQAIQGALFRAAASPVPYLLQFEAFDRTLAPPSTGGGSSSDAPFFINVSDAADLVIDGGGSVIVFSRITAYVQLVNCSRVSVQNFAFDLVPLPYTALAIDAVDAGALSVTATLLPAHPTLESLTAAMSPSAASDAKAGLYSMAGPDGSPATKRGVPEGVRYSNFTRVAGGGGGGGGGGVRYSMGLTWVHSKTHTGLSGVAVGDVIVVDPRIDAGLRVWGGEQTTLRSVLVRSCPNECFSSVHASSLAILGCGTVLVPGRLLAANNGGHNHHGARIGQWVEGGIWENAGDDTIHVSGLVLSPIGFGPAGDSQLLLGANEPITAVPAFKHISFVRPGDLLQFWDSRSGAILARRTVTAAEPPTQHRPYTLVTLDAPVGPGLAFGHATANTSATQVYSFNCTSNQFVFRKNRVRNGRRVGVLYKGYRSWIDSNSFEGLGGGALEMWNAPVEGLWAHSVLFREGPPCSSG